MAKCCWLPTPPDAKASGGSALRAYSTNSGKVLAGTFGLIARMNWLDATLETGMRSFSGSNGILA